MKKQSILVMGLTFTIGSLAHAAAPLPTTLLGEIDGIVSSCVALDPRDDDKFAKLRKTYFAGVSAASVEKNPDYRAASTLLKNIFREMTPDAALQLCKSGIN
jgi:hypothetical protein